MTKEGPSKSQERAKGYVQGRAKKGPGSIKEGPRKSQGRATEEAWRKGEGMAKEG